MGDTKNMSDQFESLLRSYHKSNEPDPAYLARIRTDLLTAASKKETKHPGFSGNWSLANWRYAVAAALLLIIVAVTVIGPARVWAQFESWIAYLPGLGRVELSGSRALEEPAVHSEGGISFQVEQFIASPDETFVSIHITGLASSLIPSSDSSYFPGIPSTLITSSGSIYIQWDDPDGQRKGVAMRMAQGSPTFPPCPSEGCPSDIQPDGYDLLLVYDPLGPDVNQVQVQWLTYGMVPGAYPTDTWTLDISLTQISEENAQDLLQPGYSPLSAEDSQHGITITVDNVFSSGSWTIIDASIAMLKSAGQPNFLGLSLSTDTGDLLEPIRIPNDLYLNSISWQNIEFKTPGSPTLMVWPILWQSSPIEAQSTQMTLSIESIDLYHGVWFVFDVETGQDPEVGTTIPLDISFDVDGFPLHIYEARIVMVPEINQSGTNNVMAIEFALDRVLSADGRNLRAVWFSQYGQVFRDPIIDRQPELTIGRLALDPDMIRDGKIRVKVNWVVLEQEGPWVISWDIPQEKD